MVLLIHCTSLSHFPNDKFLESSKLKEFADDNFKFDENGRKFSKMVENTIYEQFLLFPQCFQKTCTADRYKPGLVWKRVNMLTPVSLQCSRRLTLVENLRHAIFQLSACARSILPYNSAGC